MVPVSSVFKGAVLPLLLIVFLTVFPNSGQSQEFGRFRPGISWQQIDDPAVRVIFPKGLEDQASRVASNIRFINQNHLAAIGLRTKKINLILNNQGIISNGYVTLMPYRSEFYTTPLQSGFELGSLPWLDLLSLHEYRHALQYINARDGLTKGSWWLTGESGWGAMINLSIPGWFFEGDAVATETSLTNQGRGRMPSFLEQYKSILTGGKPYSYMKARNGSFRDIVPNEYELGYLLCSYGRENFGNNLWAEVIKGSSLLTGVTIYPFALALWTQTQLTTGMLYRKSFADYRKKWTQQLTLTALTPVKPLSPPIKTVTYYRFPVYLPNGDLIVYKSSYDQPGAIYRMSGSGKEEKICNTGITQDPYFTAAGNLITWSEVTWDPRYSSVNYSDIVIYQTDIHKKKYLTHKQRYFSPALSPDATQIVVVETDPAGKCLLKIIDSNTGEVITTLPNEENLFLTYPRWDPDGKSIFITARTATGKMLIISQDLSDGRIRKITAESSQVIGELLVLKDSLLFSTGLTGTNNIYSLNRSDGTIRQLTSAKFGAYHAAVDPANRKLIYSDVEKRGYRLVSAPMDSLAGISARLSPINQPSPLDFKYFGAEGGDMLSKVPKEEFKITPYHQLRHAVKVHSWFLTPGFTSIDVGAVSDNILNNVHIEGGLSYFYNENAPGINATIQYGGFYPILSASLTRNFRYTFAQDFLGISTNPTLQSLDNAISLGAEVPLNFSRGEFYRQAAVKAGYSYISSQGKSIGSENYGKTTTVNALSAEANISSVRKKAYQNITTPLGINLELSARQAFASLNSSQYQAIADFAIRGLKRNHNLVISAGWKQEATDNEYRFMDLFIYPRGFTIPSYDNMFTIQSSYHFPVLYPDWGFWGIFYCSRVRASLFADYGYASIDGPMASTGTELTLDTRLFNIVDLPLGVRVSLLLTPDINNTGKRTNIEFVIPIIRL